jgi:alanine racemase
MERKDKRFLSFENFNKQLVAISTQDQYFQHFAGIPITTNSCNEVLPVTWLEIDFKKLDKNYGRIKTLLNDNAGIIGVVKSDAYGHGLVPVSRRLVSLGVDKIAVATMEDAIALRASGITAPIMCLYPPFPWQVSLLVLHDVEVTVTDVQTVMAVSNAAKTLGKTIKIHLQVETGMNRYGLAPTDILDVVPIIGDLDNVVLEGISTHFSSAENDLVFLEKQFQLFMEILKVLARKSIVVPIIHVANSATTDFYHRSWLADTYKEVMPGSRIMVRVGGLFYGTYQPSGIARSSIATESIVTRIVTHVLDVKRILPGESVGYFREFVADTEMSVATLPVGWGGNGFFAKHPEVIIHGKKLPAVGVTGSNAFAINCENIDCSICDRALLLGEDGEVSVSLHDLCKKSNMVMGRLIILLGAKFQRVYYE